VRDVDGHLAADVIQAERLPAGQVDALAVCERRALAEQQPWPIDERGRPDPVEKDCMDIAAGRRVTRDGNESRRCSRYWRSHHRRH
jgi:hypothetical protein